jgi:hypothetical protein
MHKNDLVHRRMPMCLDCLPWRDLFIAHHEAWGTAIEAVRFKSKLFSIGGGFHVLDGTEQPVAEISGDWKGWNFRFVTPDGTEIGRVTKKWAGLGKELFTAADNYSPPDLPSTRSTRRNERALVRRAGGRAWSALLLNSCLAARG